MATDTAIMIMEPCSHVTSKVVEFSSHPAPHVESKRYHWFSTIARFLPGQRIEGITGNVLLLIKFPSLV